MPYRRPLKKVWRSLWLVCSCCVFVFIGLVFLKFYEDDMRSRERGRLVSSIVDQQFRQLSTGLGSTGLGSMDTGVWNTAWKDDSLGLEHWVIQESMSSHNSPLLIAQELKALGGEHPHSMAMEMSMRRWQRSLQRWSQELGDGKASSTDLMEVARHRYFEAAGYKKIGRPYDATILHLWTISLLTRFIDQQSFDPKVPEALFILGSAYLSLNRALPRQMRGDRILNLCSELYPDSFWANRSNGIWREEVSEKL